MPTSHLPKYPEYTRNFADVYLAELDYVIEWRKNMGLPEAVRTVEKESIRVREELLEEQRKILAQEAAPKSEKKEKKSIFGRFVSWISKPFRRKSSEAAPRLNVKLSTDAGLVGLALSGGGIRSATFNLGLLQSLAKNKVLQYCDYLSTVSGGGYIGSCLTSLLVYAPQASTKPDEFPLRLEEPREVNYLRKTKNYLGLNGSILNLDFWHVFGTILPGIVKINITPIALILILASILYLLTFAVEKAINYISVGQGILFGGAVLFTLIVFISLVALINHKLLIIRASTLRTWREATVGILIVVIMLIIFTILLKTQNEHVNTIIKILNYVLGFSLLVIFLKTRTRRKLLTIAQPFALIALFPSLFAYIIYFFHSISQSYDQFFQMMAIVTGVMLMIGSLPNLNTISLHYYYRDRLSNTYLIRRRKNGEIEPNQSLLLKDIHQCHNGPYHLINTTLNIPDSINPSIVDRGADFFIFSKLYCGAESTGYKYTASYDSGKTKLATAMAISGAAVSPERGGYTNPLMAFIMTLLNFRLNLWMPNPKPLQLPKLKLIFWPFYLFRELFYKGTENDTLLNLSDGGHHENLGVYPLLKRRCRVIIASDAGADPRFQMEDFANLQRKARIDLGIDIQINLAPLHPYPENGYSDAHFVKGTISYPDGEEGKLFYIKTSLTGFEPEDLLAYQRKNNSFPHETTADQFFYEDQFESYRKLGEFVGDELCCSKKKDNIEIEKELEKIFVRLDNPLS